MKKLVVSLALLALSPCIAFAQDIEKRLAEIDPRVYPPGSDEAKNAPLLLGKFLKAERDRVNRDDVAAWRELAALDEKDRWDKFVALRIANLKKSLGTFPALEAADVPVHVAKTLPGEGFAIDNLVYESRPGLWVTANLYRPDPLPKSAPGILIVHAHHNPKTHGELQDMGMTWARAGCYVLIPDQLGHGERRQHPFVDKTSYPQPFKVDRQDYYFRYNLGVQLHLAGESFIGWMANDMIAGVTLLLKKPNIDPARIILLGSVAGGGDPAAVTAALDKRIGCLVPFNFGGPQPETKYPLPDDAETSFNYFGGGSWESSRNLADSAPGGFLPWVIVASIAPRHLIHAHEFAWDGERDPVWKRYQKVWGWYGAQDKLGVAHGKGGLSGKYPEATHCNNIGFEHRAMIHPLFKKWFGIDVPPGEYKKRISGAELICWTPELKAKLKPRMVHELAGKLWEERRPSGREDVAQISDRLRLIMNRGDFGDTQDTSIVKKDRVEEMAGGVIARRLVLAGRAGLETPLLILTPGNNGASNRMVIALAQHGKQAFFNERRAEIAGLLRQGIAVCLPDLPGGGESANRGESRGRTSGATTASSTLRMLGVTRSFVQLNSFFQVAEFVGAEALKRKQVLRICVWTESFAKVNSATTLTETPYDVDSMPALAEPLELTSFLWLLGDNGLDKGWQCQGVMARGGLISFGNALKTPFFNLPHDVLDVPALPQLEAEDAALWAYTRMKESLRKMYPFRLESMVDGLNRAVTQAEMDRSFARFRQVHGETDRLMLRAERSGPDELVRWFVKCFE